MLTATSGQRALSAEAFLLGRDGKLGRVGLDAWPPPERLDAPVIEGEGKLLIHAVDEAGRPLERLFSGELNGRRFEVVRGATATRLYLVCPRETGGRPLRACMARLGPEGWLVSEPASASAAILISLVTRLSYGPRQRPSALAEAGA